VVLMVKAASGLRCTIPKHGTCHVFHAARDAPHGQGQVCVMRIFISYARKDQAAVEALNADLERARIQVWMDEELIGGESWWDTILEQIRSCDLYIFALSPNSLRSRACKAELDYAIALSRPLLPVLIQDVAIQLAHPAIARTQMVDYRKRSMESLMALMAVVANRPPAPPLPNPLPAAPTTPMSYMNEFRELVDAPDLTYQKQSYLLLDLKGYLDRDEERDIALQLLRGLRQRRDISYSIAREIDQLLEFANEEDQSPTRRTAGAPHDEHRSPEPTSQGLDLLQEAPLYPEERPEIPPQPPTSPAATPSVDDQAPRLRTKAAPVPMAGQPSGMPGSAEAPPTAEEADVSKPAEAVAAELGRQEPPPSHAPPERRSPPTAPARTSGSPASESGGRRRVALILAAAAVVAGSLVVAAVNLWPTPGAPTSEPSPSSTEASESIASSPPASKTPVPRSTPLTDTQLLVPVHVDGTYDIYLGDVTKNAPVRPLIKRSGNDTAVTLSPDRASMIYDHDRVLQVAAANGTGSRRLFSSVPKECAESSTRPGWNSADPTQIVTACVDADGKAGVYLVTIDGKVIRKLSEGDDRVGDPGFSPDGKFVIFWANAGVLGDSGFDGGDIVVASTDGKEKPRRVTRMTDTVYDADPAWSPTGDQIAFRRRDRSGDRANSDVYVIDADGKSEAKPLAADPHADEQNPSWSPSGDEIAYKSNAKAAAWPGPPLDRVWVMNSNGDNQRVLWSSSGGAQLGAQIAPSSR
jgi:TIR domain/WD40-like Beta Propeller Repeat